ncbi:MAG: hypothetical protein WCJ29_02575 [bacterium]
MNQTVKMIVIAVSAAVLGGGLVLAGVKMGSASTKEPVKEVAVANVVTVPAEEQPAQVAVPKGVSPKAVVPGAAKAPTPVPVAAATGIDAQLSALLSSSAWCSFSYSSSGTGNAYGDSSSSSRYAFYNNGTFSSGSSSESYSNGYGGTATGGGNGGSAGQWKISGSKLYVSSSETGGQFVDVGASLTQNSNGYPIITVGGTEFTKCR